MSRKLKTMDAETLMTTPMVPLKFIVSSLLPEGLHVLAGSPKIGKSWLALWICLQVAKGEKAEKYSRTAPQDIWIHYRDIGMLNDVKEEFYIPSMEEFYGTDNEIMLDDELPAAI